MTMGIMTIGKIANLTLPAFLYKGTDVSPQRSCGTHLHPSVPLCEADEPTLASWQHGRGYGWIRYSCCFSRSCLSQCSSVFACCWRSVVSIFNLRSLLAASFCLPQILALKNWHLAFISGENGAVSSLQREDITAWEYLDSDCGG